MDRGREGSTGDANAGIGAPTRAWCRRGLASVTHVQFSEEKGGWAFGAAIRPPVVTHRAVSDKPTQGHQGEGLPIPGEYPAARERLASFRLPTIQASRAPLRNDRQECVGIQWNAAHEVVFTR